MKLIFEYEEQTTTGHVMVPDISEYDDGGDKDSGKDCKDILFGLPKDLVRKELPLPNVSEVNVVRHYTNMSRMNYGIDVGFYPLGSCTMKYNPKINEDVARLEGFINLHPLSDDGCIQGSLQLMWEFEQDLREITGMDVFSLQPAAGAQAELLGVMITKAYYKQKKNVEKRTKIIIPDSAHGTNPATAAMCKFETITIPSDSRGNMDICKFKESLKPDVALVMLTNPNTLGLYEEKILEISDLAHTNGTLMYCDGANMNALLGITRPSDQGFDMIHLNLHKSFSTPHGGGGPGAGALGVKSFLADYLPLPRIINKQQQNVINRNHDDNNKYDNNNTNFTLDYTKRKSIGTLRYSYGNFGMLVRAYCYIKSYGTDIRKISEYAILNANYLLSLLKDDFELAYSRGRCAHEFVLSSKKFGDKSALNIAKRLLDYGFHPPTIYFPLIVAEALMIEPTETESKETLDRFASTLRSIANEIKEKPDIARGAPYTKSVGRLDEVTAARKPNLRWKNFTASQINEETKKEDNNISNSRENLFIGRKGS